MKRKFLSLALCLMMVLSFMVVPASAEGEVTLLESWFENANGEKVYDTTAAAEVTPAFYVNNETGAAIEGAKLVLASYDANGKLTSVNYAAAPTIAMGESKVEAEESIDVSQGGETYMMIWDTAFAPVISKSVLTAASRDTRIVSFKVGEVEGKITNELYYRTASAGTYSYEKSVLVTLPAASTEDLTAITPTIELPTVGATVSPASGVAQDFSEGKTVSYTVTAADGITKQTYTVAVAKNDLKVYSEGASAAIDFPDYDDVNATTAKTSVSYDSSTWTDSYYHTTYTNRNHSWAIALSNSKVPSSGKLYYTGEQISAGKVVLVDDEELTDNWFNSDGTEATVVEGETDTSSLRKYVVTYAEDDTEKANPKYTLTSALRITNDPTNSKNLVLRYDKRGASVSSNNFETWYLPKNVDANKTELSKVNYTFRLYVPKTAEAFRYMFMNMWVSKDTRTTSAFKLLTGVSGDDLIFRASSSNNDGYELATIENGLNKWLNISVDIDTNKEVSVYCDGVLVAKTNILIATPSNTVYGPSSYGKYLFGFGARDTTSFGSLIVDDIKVEVQNAPVAEETE